MTFCPCRGVKQISDYQGGLLFGAEEQGIKELLDINLIKQKVANSSFDYTDCIRLVEGIVGILCSIQEMIVLRTYKRQKHLASSCHSSSSSSSNKMEAAPASSSRSRAPETQAKWMDVLAKLQAAREKRERTQVQHTCIW